MEHLQKAFEGSGTHKKKCEDNFAMTKNLMMEKKFEILKLENLRSLNLHVIKALKFKVDKLKFSRSFI